MKTYGNLDLPEGTDERPLVTFALFAYNQEKYIREAVEGAFSQTYSPLEIILSDDCSSDRTFEIMQEMAANYHGRHRVITRRNAFNLGTALHVQAAFSVSCGRLFVVAAGDDISTSERVDCLNAAWALAGSPEGAIHSGREVFGTGIPTRNAPVNHNRYSDNVLAGFARAYWLPAAAPSCAYTRSVFEHFDPLLGGIIEDAPLQLRASLIGRFVPCKRLLVRQRVHEGNTGTGYRLDTPSRWNRFITSKLIAFRTMQRDLIGSNHGIDPRLKQRIERRILAVIHSAPALLLPESRSVNRFERIRLAIRIIISPAIANNIRSRAVFMLDFFGYKFHRRIKAFATSVIRRNE